jgi:hypothetical protein
MQIKLPRGAGYECEKCRRWDYKVLASCPRCEGEEEECTEKLGAPRVVEKKTGAKARGGC